MHAIIIEKHVDTVFAYEFCKVNDKQAAREYQLRYPKLLKHYKIPIHWLIIGY